MKSKSSQGDESEQPQANVESAFAQEIAGKINLLFQTCRDENGDRYSYSEVAEKSNGKINASWISKMATGQALRPGLLALKTLTDFFDVDPSYWFEPAGTLPRQKRVVEAPVHPSLTSRSLGLSVDDLNNIPAQDLEVLIQMYRQLKGITPNNGT